MVNTKYVLTDETKVVDGHTLHRIKAISDFGDVKAGDLGGWIESEEDLSRFGSCWVYDEACVYGEAGVYNKACVYGEAVVYDEACIYGEAVVRDKAQVYDRAHIYGKAQVFGEAKICGKAEVFGEAHVYGTAYLNGDMRIHIDADVTHQYDCCCIDVIGSRKGTTTFFKAKQHAIRVSCGCFQGSIEEFAKAVEDTHGDNKHGKAYKAAIEYAKTVLALN